MQAGWLAGSGLNPDTPPSNSNATKGGGGGERRVRKCMYPTNIGITRGTPSIVTTLVVVSDGVARAGVRNIVI